MVYTASAWLVRLGLGSVSRFEVLGHEHVPAAGGCVVACNHTCALDPLYLGLAVRPRKVHFMTKQELFRIPLLRNWLYAVGAYPVNRSAPGPSVMKETLRLLRQGEVVGIFPEGTRHAEHGGLKTGAVRLALKAGVPLLPAAYHGPRSLSPLDLLRRPLARVVFGPPLATQEYAGRRSDDAAIAELVGELGRQIQTLYDRARA